MRNALVFNVLLLSLMLSGCDWIGLESARFEQGHSGGAAIDAAVERSAMAVGAEMLPQNVLQPITTLAMETLGLASASSAEQAVVDGLPAASPLYINVARQAPRRLTENRRTTAKLPSLTIFHAYFRCIEALFALNLPKN